jgi:aerobic carbon-monoxide dehydrogenase large subunit
MSTSHAPNNGVGARLPRVEDARLLTGRGCFVDDVVMPEQLYAIAVRSEVAHADLAQVDTARALAVPGVVAVYTASDLFEAGVQPLMPVSTTNLHTGEPFAFVPMPVLAGDKVNYVGECVAWVVANSVAIARAAAEQVQLEYAPRAAVTDAVAALDPGAPCIADEVPGNCCLDWRYRAGDAVDQRFDGAAHVVKAKFRNHRIIAQPMEMRGALAVNDADTGAVSLRLASQNVHGMRDHIARSLGLARERLRVHADDVGGGFGSRNFCYPEYVLTAFSALALKRPVKWINTRVEGCLSDHHARDVTTCAALALDGQGRFLALRTQSVFAAGGYMTGVACGVPTYQYLATPESVYDIGAVELGIRVALTNTAPIGVTRGPGFAETVDVLERLIDIAAVQTGLDRIELRRTNLIAAAAMPWTNVAGTRFDSGDFAGCMEQALEKSAFLEMPTRRAQSAARGKRRGIGLACHVKGTGGLPEENVLLEFMGERLIFTTGTQAIGQGHETSFRQILNELLGVPLAQIEYRAGDSALIPMGGGHGSSRATFMASTAMARASDRIIQQGKETAAGMFECAVADVSFERGWFQVQGTDLRAGLFAVAARAREQDASLDTYEHFVREALTWPNGCHVAEVEVDPETGAIELMRYVAVDDHGTLVNPLLVEGQSHGAIMQGVAQALLEGVSYAPESGQMLSASFMDYAMPRAGDLVGFETSFRGQQCTTNPLGVKGAGEPGAIAGFPAVLNAVADALGGAAAREMRAPLSAASVWRQLHRQTDG